MTHLHYDHASGATQFPGATFLVDRREWDAANSGGMLQGYHRPHLDPALRWRAIDAEPRGRPVRRWERSALPHAGAHAGSPVPAAALGGGERLLVTADAAYGQRTLDERLSAVLRRPRRLPGLVGRLIALSGEAITRLRSRP